MLRVEIVQKLIDEVNLYQLQQNGVWETQAEAPPDALVRCLADAAGTLGTPVYVVAETEVLAAARTVEAAFPRPWLHHYSVKANDHPAVVRCLLRQGWGANVVSVGEWAQTRAAGSAESDVTFEGIGKTDSQLAEVVAAAESGRPLRWVVVESAEEAAVLGELAERAGLGVTRPPLDVLARLNPEVEPETTAGWAVGATGSKFGMLEDEIMLLATRRSVGLRWRGVHVHVGSALGSPLAWSEAGVKAAALCARLGVAWPAADTVDFGGGFPANSADVPLPYEFRAALDAAMAVAGVPWPARCAIEPGRYLVADAGWLVTRVLHSRRRNGHPQVVVDAGMTEFIRPALYGARHPLLPVEVALDGPSRPTAVEGAVCESTDSFGRHRLPPLQRGDVLAIGQAGAYGSSFTSRFNGRPEPVEALLRSDGTLEVTPRAPLPPGCPPAGASG